MPTRSTRARTERRGPALHLSIQLEQWSDALPIERAQLRRWVRAALERDAEIGLRMVGTREARRLNREYRGRDYATNVLTFVYDSAPVRADVVICLPVALREARAQRVPAREHLAHLVVHGVLHAQGYDHEHDADAERMEAREAALLARFRIADPYAR